MDFEAALSMLKKNKAKKAAEKEAEVEENQPEEPEIEAFETITTSSGRKFRHVRIINSFKDFLFKRFRVS